MATQRGKLRSIEIAGRPPEDPERAIRREELLRLEIRHCADVMLRLVQWGVTLQIAVATITFYARREIKADLATLHHSQTSLLPWDIHIIGTLFLAMLAAMFTLILWLAQKRRMMYRWRLYDLSDKLIDESRPTKHGNWIYPVMFWSFPLVDILIRAYYSWIVP
jgi:hypothetical protein